METEVGQVDVLDTYFEGKLYLVTGGTGFLGLWLIPTLMASGAKVRVLARSPPGKGERIEGVEYVAGSVTDLDSLIQAAAGVDGIFHLAGTVIHSRLPEFQKTIYDTNVVGTMNVLKAAKENKVKRIVYASTSGTIGCSTLDVPIRDGAPYCTDIVGNWPYYASKIESEIQALEYANKNRLEVIFMRPSVMLGPGDLRFRSTHMILSYMDGKIPVVPPGGYSFVDVRDAAEAMKKGVPGKGYLLGAYSPSIDTFFSMLSEASGAPKPRVKLPKHVFLYSVIALDLINRKQWNESFDPVKGEMGIHYWNIIAQRARDELGWRTREPMQTILDTVEWIQKHRTEYGCPPKAKL